MNTKTILFTVLSLFIAFPVFAADYPVFAGITISETTTAAEYIVYFFNLLVAIGALIAVVMVMMAGIEWVTSSGNPSKVESAKGKIINTLLGVGVLMGCYLILNTINPQLKNIKIDDLVCEHGIVVSVKPVGSEKIKQKCIDSNQKDIVDTIISTIKWKFPEDYLLKVYTYTEKNYKGVIKEFNCRAGACGGGSDIAGAKSIYFVMNNPGIYLYDDNSYGPASPAIKSYPVFTSSSIADLSNINSFDNFTKSLQIVNPNQEVQKIQYQAVVFKDQNYQGRCAFVAQSVSDMDQAPNGYYTDNIGDNAVSSIIVVKANLDEVAVHKNRGEIILYTKTDCGQSDNSTKIKACHLPIEAISGGQVNISKACREQGNKFVDGDEVMSFEITGAAGLVLSTSEKLSGNADTYCQYFDKASLKEGTCFSSIINTSIFTPGGKNPKSFIILPSN